MGLAQGRNVLIPWFETPRISHNSLSRIPSYYQYKGIISFSIEMPSPEKYLVMDYGTLDPSEPVELESPISKT